MKMLAKFLLQGLALVAITAVVPGFYVERFTSALLLVFMLGLVNIILRPILLILTLPITLLTFGLFIFVINFVLFWFVTNILKGVMVDSFGSLVLAWILYSLAVMAINAMFTRSDRG